MPHDKYHRAMASKQRQNLGPKPQQRPRQAVPLHNHCCTTTPPLPSFHLAKSFDTSPRRHKFPVPISISANSHHASPSSKNATPTISEHSQQVHHRPIFRPRFGITQCGHIATLPTSASSNYSLSRWYSASYIEGPYHAIGSIGYKDDGESNQYQGRQEHDKKSAISSHDVKACSKRR